jgi:hypothetical protein
VDALSHDAPARLSAFARRFGRQHIRLAAHAAFPLLLTPDLLYGLWASFVRPAPWTAVADVLLSDLCREVGYELYEMDKAIRQILLRRLQRDEGEDRLRGLAAFLTEYARGRLDQDDAVVRHIAQAQQWTALAYMRTEQAARELAQALAAAAQKLFAGHPGPDDLAEVLRLTSLVASIEGPLAEFHPLVFYSEAVTSMAHNRKEEATELMERVRRTAGGGIVAGIVLPQPDEAHPRPEPMPSAPTGVNLLRKLATYGVIIDVAWSPDGTLLACAGISDTVRIWDTCTGAVIRELRHPTSRGIFGVAWSRDGKLVATGCSDGLVRLWAAHNGTVVQNLSGHLSSGNAVGWSPDSRTIASASSDGTIRLWRATENHVLQGHDGPVYGFCWSPDSTRLASGGSDGGVRLWDVATGETIRTLQLTTPPTASTNWPITRAVCSRLAYEG